AQQIEAVRPGRDGRLLVQLGLQNAVGRLDERERVGQVLRRRLEQVVARVQQRAERGSFVVERGTEFGDGGLQVVRVHRVDEVVQVGQQDLRRDRNPVTTHRDDLATGQERAVAVGWDQVHVLLADDGAVTDRRDRTGRDLA